MYSYSPFLSSYPYSRPPASPYRPPITAQRPNILYPNSFNYAPSQYGPVGALPPEYQRLSSTVENYNSVQPQRRVWSEKIPYERAYVDYYEQRHVDYVPVERAYTDYIELEHQIDYMPIPQLEKRYEYLPVDRYRSTVDYMEVKNSQVVSNSQYGYGPTQPGILAPSSPQRRNYY